MFKGNRKRAQNRAYKVNKLASAVHEKIRLSLNIMDRLK